MYLQGKRTLDYSEMEINLMSKFFKRVPPPVKIAFRTSFLVAAYKCLEDAALSNDNLIPECELITVESLSGVGRDNEDIHEAAARFGLGIPQCHVSKKQRNVGKIANFAAIYGPQKDV